MAEIKIEKKTPVWPWVLLGLILLALVIYLLTRNGDDAETAAVTTTDTTDAYTTRATGNQNTGAVSSYVEYINSDQSMDKTHEFTNGALIRLADAIEAKARQTGYTVEADIERVREAAREITQDPQALTHANKINQSASTMADVMNNIQQSKFPNLNSEAQEVKQAANSIKPDTETLQQKDAIKSFFDRSADLLQKMN